MFFLLILLFIADFCLACPFSSSFLSNVQAIISSPNKRLSVEAKELLWKFRFSLTDDQRAVTKFLRCVNWNDVTESKQALELLDEWGPITLADALELLSSAFTHEGVRAYAVKQLHTADLEEIGNYLLQLVQALRYEQTVPSFLSESVETMGNKTCGPARHAHSQNKSKKRPRLSFLTAPLHFCASVLPLLFFPRLQLPDHACLRIHEPY